MNESELLALLKGAYDLCQSNDMDVFQIRLAQAKAEIDKLDSPGAVYGEWLLLSSFTRTYDMDFRCQKFREAAQYLDGRSRVLPPRAELFCGFFNPFGICNRSPGKADEIAEKLTEAVSLYFPLTGGGMGTDTCYKAQLAFYRGDLTAAVSLATEAFNTARQYEQELCALCAADVMAQTAKHACDKRLWHYAYSYIQSIADEARPASRPCREIAQVLYAALNLSLGLIKSLPEWIIAGDFGAVSAPWGYRVVDDKVCIGTVPNALITQIQYYLYRGDPGGDPAKALNIADMVQKVYGLDNLLTSIYCEFFRAVSYAVLAGENVEARATAALARAIEQLTPDGLYLIATEFAPGFGTVLYSLAEKLNPQAPEIIRSIGENYWEKLTPFREDAIRTSPQGFTQREGEVAVLIAAGRSNAEIAERLNIAERTVEKHVSNIFSKLNVSRRVHVATAVKAHQAAETAFWAKKT